jgi:hypothetical protein
MTDLDTTATEQLQVNLVQALAENELLHESLADVQAALREPGWASMATAAAEEFSTQGRRQAAALCRILVVQNPLIKRGVAIRTGYIWGEGRQVSGRDDDVNTVIQKFDDDNKTSFSSSQAREEAEKTCATDGNIFRALPTSPLTGRVRVRTIDPAEVVAIHTNPEDRDEPWFYERRFTVNKAGTRYAGLTRPTFETKTVLYPALGFKPTARVKTIDGIEVMWDTPIQHIAVNRIDGWLYGIGDSYAAIAWARAYKEFLEDWAKLTKSLSKIAWKVSSKNNRTQKAASDALRQALATLPTPGGSDAGGVASMAGSDIEAIPKTGATIDSDSGKPLAGMVAAALGVPITYLLADPGQTGARAVAETLDTPTINEMNLRRELWTDKDRELYDYVIDQAVKAPKGPLRGKVAIDEYGREVITLAGDVDRTLDFSWPSLAKVSLETLMKAIETADSLNVSIDPLLIVRWVLEAMNEDDIDEKLAKMTDEDGNYIDPEFTAGAVAARAFRQGKNPADALT